MISLDSKLARLISKKQQPTPAPRPSMRGDNSALNFVSVYVCVHKRRFQGLLDYCWFFLPPLLALFLTFFSS